MVTAAAAEKRDPGEALHKAGTSGLARQAVAISQEAAADPARREAQTLSGAPAAGQEAAESNEDRRKHKKDHKHKHKSKKSKREKHAKEDP